MYVTVTENSTLSAPFYWLIRFVCDASGEEQACIKPNLSSYTDRYDKFNINEGTDVTLDPGIHTYYIYEQSSPSNTNYLLAEKLCETGQVTVTGVEQFVSSYPQYTIQSPYSR
jgi:hypothetical protein